MKSFSNDERLTFATQESFWNDFLQDDFDIEGFRAFYDSTDNGRIDIEKIYILTITKLKKDKYEHIGMKHVNTRTLGEKSIMYDLVRGA